MTAQQILAEAARRGVELFADGTTLRYRGPKAALAKLKPRLAAHKGKLLSMLARPEPRAAPPLDSNVEAEPEPPPWLPLDLARIAGAMARNPRSPALGDIALALFTRAAIAAKHTIDSLPPSARAVALTHCHELEDAIVNTISSRNYADAYALASEVQTLSGTLAQFCLQ